MKEFKQEFVVMNLSCPICKKDICIPVLGNIDSKFSTMMMQMMDFYRKENESLRKENEKLRKCRVCDYSQ
jgi:hypothetical protein